MLEDGELDHDLSLELEQLVEAMNEEAANSGGGAKGTITLSLAFKMKDGVIDIVPDTSVKRPKKARARTVFWSDAQNNLTRQNPRQQELPLRTVPLGTEVRQV